MPWTQLYLHGLGVSVSHNAQAFGFSILITVSYGVVSSVADQPTPFQLIGFALSAVASLSFLNLMVAFLKRDEPDDSERTPVLAGGAVRRRPDLLPGAGAADRGGPARRRHSGIACTPGRAKFGKKSPPGYPLPASLR